VVNLLVVESDEAMAGSLRRAGHDVTVARSERDVRAFTASGSFDAVVLGKLGPGDRNLALCGALRRDGVGLPIVLIVARDGVESRIEGLDAGADDCVGTGCPADELLARLRALVRRSSLRV
jgi:DNA-binding response OmpR family regulator